MIYLDNNATTFMPVSVREAMVNWCNMGNPSANYKSAQQSRQMMTKFMHLIGKICAIDIGDSGDNKYNILITSCASEANCTLLRAVIDAYIENIKSTPHIVMSAIEHKSLLLMAESFEARGIATVTYIRPRPSGHIRPEDVGAAIRPNTAIVCVMHANNETGAINDIRRIGEIAHRKNIPFHCDTVQSFCKYPVRPNEDNIDSFCISFHKFGGPPGVGMLILRRDLLLGYKLSPAIFGTQNQGMRGGTENIPGIGAAFEATKIALVDRAKKNNNTRALVKYMVGELSARMPVRTFTQYITSANTSACELVIFSLGDSYLPNTLLVSIIKRTKPYICNTEIKTELESRGIIVSIGSACNTSSDKASHVLYAMGADELVRRGTLRISLGDMTTREDIKKFIIEFLTIIKRKCS